MSYAWDITIPANTPCNDPITKILKLDKGTISKVGIKFPSGCHGMVKVRLYRYEQQLVPLNRDGWITGDDEVVEYRLFYPLTEKPYELKFVGCSPGTNYDHTVTVRIEVQPLEHVSYKPLTDTIKDVFRRLRLIR